MILSTTRRSVFYTRLALMTITATAVILRAELAMLLVPLVLLVLIQRRVPLKSIIFDGALSGVLAVGKSSDGVT